jgi:hypothetical protein
MVVSPPVSWNSAANCCGQTQWARLKKSMMSGSLFSTKSSPASLG